MAIFIKDGQRKIVEDHLVARINVLLGQGWAIEAAKVVGHDNQPPVTVLPDDFPGRAPLLDAGLATVEAVRERATGDGLESIKGIGPATADEINAAL